MHSIRMCEFMSANRVLTDKSDSYRNGRYREEHQCTHTKQSERKTNSVNKRISFTSFIIALMVCLGVLLPACIGTKHPDRPSPTPDAVDPVATQPSASPGMSPTVEPTEEPTFEPTAEPTAEPTDEPFFEPTEEPNSEATDAPSAHVTEEPTGEAQSLRVYLTFDDGPCKNTAAILKILEDYNIKASFFTVGYFIDRYPEMVAETVNAGHLVCCHTYSHDMQQVYASTDAFMQDVDQWCEAFISATGSEPPCRILRFPGGSNNPYMPKDLRSDYKQAATENGWRYFDWTFGDNDRWPAGNVENLPEKEYLITSFRSTLRMAISAGRPLIFLAHDTSDASVELLPEMLDEMIEMGCTFGTIDELESSFGF